MKISEYWLRSWVNPALSASEIGEQLTMAGLELDELHKVAKEFSGVVVGQVLSCEQHPDADKLKVTTVDIGTQTLQIVCGATNVEVGIKVPVATVGAKLPPVDGDKPFHIKNGKLRGVESQGMLCGGLEIDCDDGVDGLLILPSDAPIGMDVRDYLGLDNHVLDISITPNRGDCFSVRGIARELAVANRLPFAYPFEHQAPIPSSELAQPVKVSTPACPRYLAQVVTHLSAKPSPKFIKDALMASGINPKNILIDVTNYVLMELGQPLHAFDKAKLVGDITVRIANAGERLVLLNEEEITLVGDELVICDDAGVIALAGIMGGLRTAVTDDTTEIVLESAFFDPLAIAGRARRFGLHTDASQRFERGVDFELPSVALDRAAALLHEFGGGKVAQKTVVESTEHLPTRPTIILPVCAISKRLGVQIDSDTVLDILGRLEMTATLSDDVISVTPPSHRFDISIKEDVIEEIARIYGYNNIANTLPSLDATLFDAPDERAISAIKSALVGQGYFEAISFSFADSKVERYFDCEGSAAPLALVNPISSELAVMRRTLLSSLLPCVLHNQNRQQHRVRLFETGLVFLGDTPQTLTQKNTLGMVATGSVMGETPWTSDKAGMDFYEFKADIESILPETLIRSGKIRYQRSTKPFLHGGQSADVLMDDAVLGYFGQLHPKVAKALDLPCVWVGEFDLDGLIALRQKSTIVTPSKFPSVRRDFAFIVDDKLSWQDIAGVVADNAGEFCGEIVLFDVYTGERVGESKKSLAFGVVWQHHDRTLTDDEIKTLSDKIISALQAAFDAKLRDS